MNATVTLLLQFSDALMFFFASVVYIYLWLIQLCLRLKFLPSAWKKFTSDMAKKGLCFHSVVISLSVAKDKTRKKLMCTKPHSAFVLSKISIVISNDNSNQAFLVLIPGSWHSQSTLKALLELRLENSSTDI